MFMYIHFVPRTVLTTLSNLFHLIIIKADWGSWYEVRKWTLEVCNVFKVMKLESGETSNYT